MPSQHYLASAVVDQTTNEIPVARGLFNRLELEGRLTVMGNQPTVREQIQTLVTAPEGDFPPHEPWFSE